MTQIESHQEVALPDDVSASVDDGTVTVDGPKGTTHKDLFHPLINITADDNSITLEAERSRQREKQLLNTYTTHVQNLIKGVREGITYELQVCASHFPMNVSVDGDTFTIENYLGERTPRTMNIPDDVDITVDEDTITVEGVNKEQVGQTAASIEKLARRTGFDRRVFQDGIYITNKDGRKII